ncbi:unnamed protein product, partial [Mesorhabditis spiculigera]
MEKQSACCTECGFTSKDMEIFAVHVDQHEKQQILRSDSNSEQSNDWTEENVDSPNSSPRDSISSLSGERSPPLIIATANNVKAEKRTHVCPHCNFTTFMSQHMKSHLEAHERHQGQMYQCDVCQMQFSQKANMHRHRMRHSGVKPYECRYCKKRFFRKDQMQEHSMTHIKTGADFDCPVAGCPAVFTQHSTLRAHLDETHIISTSAPASCKLCTLLFSNSRRLLLHYQTKHDDSEASAILREGKREPRKKRSQTANSVCASITPQTVLPTANIIQPIPMLPSTAAMAAALQSHIQNLVQKGFGAPLAPIKTELPPVKVEYERPYSLSNEDLLMALSNTAAAQQAAMISESKETVLRMWAGELNGNGLSSLPSPPAHHSHSPSVDSGASSGEGSSDDASTKDLQCNHCGIVFYDRTLQLLHKGLHTEHDPWRCNLCGHLCADKYMFTTHIISSNHMV